MIRTKAAITLGAVALLSSFLLILHHVASGFFPPHSQEFLAAVALSGIALAWLLWQWTRRPGAFLRAILLAAAFLFWAANQLWPDIETAALFNDIAVGLFVLDVFLAMTGTPSEA